MSVTVVTGGAGFIGSHLVDRLVADGRDVIVIDDLSTGTKANLNPRAKLFRFDVAFPWAEHLEPVLDSVDCVFHLAAQSRVVPSFTDVERTFRSNDVGTFRAIQYCVLRRCRIVYAGTSCTGVNALGSPYAYTKTIGEWHLSAAARWTGLPYAIGRIFNAYGPRHLEDGPHATVLGIFARRKRLGIPLTVCGDGEQRRDFVHVDDVVDGLLALERASPGTRVDLGSGTNHSVNEIAAMFKHPVERVAGRPGENVATLADVARSKELIGYEPKRKLEDWDGFR